MHDVMPQLEIPDQGNPFYDHEADADLRLGGRRAVADWGADDLFHHTPRRRRSATSLAARERRLSGPVGGEGSVHHLEEVNREAAMRRFEREAAEGRPAPAEAHAGAVVTRIEEAPSYVADMPVEPVEAERAVTEATGRRTVAITGRPEKLPPARPHRRRPPKTVEERIGAQPDRMAAWAVGLGMLLIVLAILTA